MKGISIQSLQIQIFTKTEPCSVCGKRRNLVENITFLLVL